MSWAPGELPAEALEFLAERHLATLTTLRADGSPHVVPVGFTWDAARRVARVITGGGTVKALNAAAGRRAVLCQVDRARWLSLEGVASVREDAESVDAAVAAYAGRYRQPRPNPERVVVEITVDRVLGRVAPPAVEQAQPAPAAGSGGSGPESGRAGGSS
ncbi:pyridoxamine 5'-phosphate oxidase family protein [Motilibacter aurantiacus]|uniref:pyridoxamine 5'-phosphate oxidase family protein n=1 Tax=Motilibacter aurantiacus TaxID=2714955 RepID=UPI001409D275|nr:PPOX class F420-dependent oxidoreductase [Motilibacter aurantiacus]NHC44612.1 PPOX class F420-dependent oxidoreductase [Motilibacter aurantiacus]